MNIEWFGTERNTPELWIVERPDGTLDSYSDGTPKLFGKRADAIYYIFNQSVDRILDMDADSRAEKGITPILMDMCVTLLHTEDINAIEEAMQQHRFLNPIHKEVRTLKKRSDENDSL